MPQFDDNHVKLCGGRVVWDGVTRPEIVQQGQQAGKQKYTLKVVFPPSCPDLAIYNQLANKSLMESKWRGQLPAGGRMPIGQVQPGEFQDMFPGWAVISFKTTLRAPDVYDENGRLLDPMAYSKLLFGNQQVDVLAHCYEYDAAGNKGISAGLDGFAIIASANAQPVQFGTGVNTAAAFGGGAGMGQPAPNAAPGWQSQQHTAAPGPGAPGATAGPVPVQAHNFLPGGTGAPAPGPGPAPAPVPAVKYQTPDGRAWTEAQLLASNWAPAQIQALPRV